MSEAISATYDVPGRRIPGPAMAAPARHPAPRRSIRRAHPLDDGLTGPSAWKAAWQVREDRAFYVPDVMSDRSYNTDAELYDAADEHARDLRKAQRNLEDAFNLAQVVLAAVRDDGDSRAMQVEAVVKVVERKLNKALDQLDRHDSRDRNLFFAYFDLQETAEEGGDKE